MRSLTRRIAVVALAGLAGAFASAGELAAQDGGRSSGGRARVVVGYFGTSGGVDGDFGKEIAKRVREQVKDFQLLTAVSNDEMEELMDRFELDEDQMDLIAWRQLAGRLDAQLVIWGQVAPASARRGNTVDALFVDTNRGEETEVPSFTVTDDDDDAAEEAAREIVNTLDRHVQFLRAVLNCQDYLSGEQYPDAARNCDKALEINPESPRALYLRGQVAQGREQWDEAQGYFSQVVAQDSSDENALQSLAYVEAQLGNTEKATRLYREYLEFNPDDQDVRLSVAYNLASAGAYQEAMEIVRRGIERDSSSAPLWKYLGDLAIQEGTQAGRSRLGGGNAGSSSATITDTSAIHTAIEAYQEYAKLRPDSVQSSLYKNIAAAHIQLDQHQQASAAIDEALDRFGDDPSLWSLRADVLAQQGDVRAAVSSMDSVLARDSTYRNAFFKRGVLNLRAGRSQAALSDFERAVDRGRDPNEIANAIFARAYQNHFKNGRYQRAINMFETALEFAEDPKTSNQIAFFAGYGHYRIGQAIDERNKQDEACEPARRALDHFEEVIPYLNQAGDYQAKSQQSVRQGTDVFVYRQEQIIKKSCE